MTRHRRLASLATLALVAGSGLALTASSSAAGGGTASVLVPIAPCRLVDTRPGSDNVGSRSTPVGAGEVFTVSSWGTNGNCTLPSGVTGLSLNVTAVGPSASSFLTVYPADAARPLAASLNWVAGQAPTPNAVTVATSGSGTVSFYNLSGTVDLTIDVVGYYQSADTAPAGPPGAAAPRPARIVHVAPSGGDFTTVSAALASITDAGPTRPYLVQVGPGTFAEAGNVALKDWVDIAGAGRAATTIALAGTLSATGTVHTEVRDLSITAPATAVTISTTTPALALRFTRLDISVSSTGGATGVAIDHASPLLSDVAVTVVSPATSDLVGHNAIGVYVANGSAPELVDVTASVSGGLYSSALRVLTSSPSVRGGTFLLDAYRGRAIAIAGTSTGVTLTGVTVSASASGSASAIGFEVSYSSSATLVDSRVEVSGSGTFNVALSVNNKGTVTVRQSTITVAGAGPAVDTQVIGPNPTYLTHSTVIGPVVGTGDVCRAVYDAALAAAC